MKKNLGKQFVYVEVEIVESTILILSHQETKTPILTIINLS